MATSQTQNKPKPLICCGLRPTVAKAAKAGIGPEYDYIHLIFSPAQAAHDLPYLFQGSRPPPNPATEILLAPPSEGLVFEQVGSQDYSAKAIAIVLGGGFTDEMFEEMRRSTEGLSDLPWLRVDVTKKAPPLGRGYGEAVAERAKVCLRELEEGGKLGRDGVYWF